MKLAALVIFGSTAAFAGKLSDDVAKRVFEALKAEKNSEAVRAISDSASPLLKEKVAQKMSSEQIASQFDLMVRAYGKPVALELISNDKAGKFEKCSYFLYTPLAAIRLEIIEYAPPGSTPKIVHFKFDDQPIDWF